MLTIHRFHRSRWGWRTRAARWFELKMEKRRLFIGCCHWFDFRWTRKKGFRMKNSNRSNFEDGSMRQIETKRIRSLKTRKMTWKYLKVENEAFSSSWSSSREKWRERQAEKYFSVASFWWADLIEHVEWTGHAGVYVCSAVLPMMTGPFRQRFIKGNQLFVVLFLSFFPLLLSYPHMIFHMIRSARCVWLSSLSTTRARAHTQLTRGAGRKRRGE